MLVVVEKSIENLELKLSSPQIQLHINNILLLLFILTIIYIFCNDLFHF